MSVRTDVATALRAALPETWDVRDDATDIDDVEPDQPVLFVWTSRVTPGPTIRFATHELLIRIVSPVTDPQTVDDDLDELLSTLTSAIDKLSPLAWTEATRGTHGRAERFQCYTVTATAPARKD